jgi:hypothetical protein
VLYRIADNAFKNNSHLKSVCSRQQLEFKALRYLRAKCVTVIQGVFFNFLLYQKMYSYIIKVCHKSWKVLKCGVGDGWRRSVGPIMCEMKKYYLESRSRGISYMK